MDYVLDLDLDFFVWPPGYSSQPGRLDGDKHRHAAPNEVRAFLEQQCHLNTDSKIVGREMVEHVGAFWTWRQWLEEKKLSAPFAVIHVDAHADQGLGTAGFIYLLTELLALPTEQRANPPFGFHGLNSGNFLAFAVANRWISKLTDVFPERLDRPHDFMYVLFRDTHWKTGFLELKQYRREDIYAAVDERQPPPVSVEPAVPFDFISARAFDFSGFTHMILAQSPQFTPASADELLPIIGEYFKSE